jgi:hypothetical protein
MSSTVQAVTYDFPATVTKSDSVDDPAGPFAGLLVAVTGDVKFTPLAGPQAGGSMTITGAPAGMYLHFPVKRVWSSVTSATVFGLRAVSVTGVK